MLGATRDLDVENALDAMDTGSRRLGELDWAVPDLSGSGEAIWEMAIMTAILGTKKVWQGQLRLPLAAPDRDH